MIEERDEKDKFENIARELGCDESDDALDRAFEALEVKQDEKKEPDNDKK